MSRHISKYPSTLCAAKNPDVFVIQSDKDSSPGVAKLTPSFSFELWQDEMIFRDIITPLVSGSYLFATLDVSELLLGSIPRYNFLDTPTVFGTPLIRREVIFPFYVKHSENYLEIDDREVTLMSHWFYALNGGVPPWKHVEFFKTYTTFEQYFVDTKKTFLTWRWSEKLIGYDDKETLFFLNLSEHAADTCQLVFSCKFFTLTLEQPLSVPLGSVIYKAYEVLELNISPKDIVEALDINQIDIHCFNVYVSHNGHQVSEKQYYKIDYRELPKMRNFLFLNSLGAYESIRFTGSATTEDAYNRDFFDQTALTPYNTFARSKGQIAPEISTTKKVNSGWVTKEETELMRDFISSQEVYEIIGEGKYPVLVTQDKVEIHRDNSFLYSVTVSIENIDLKNVYQGLSGTMPTTGTLVSPY